MANILASDAGRNPEVGFANQRYAEAYARLIAARALWLPSINAGLGWNNHAGSLQASNGSVGEVSRNSLTAGLGVQTIGAGSPVVPGLFANFHSAEAIFQPRIANRAAAARDAAVRTTINDLLLDSALAYLELLRAHQSRAIAVDIREHAQRLAEAKHLVVEAVHRMSMENLSPFLPNVLMGTSYAAFGGGQGSQVANTAGRFDLDAITYWQVRGLGVGEYAARREARSQYDQTRLQQVRMMNRVSREIVEAHAQMLARHRQIGIAQQAVQRATHSFERNWLRVRDLEGLPIETLQSIQALDQARREYLRALVDFNAAQFRLQRALGWPIDLAAAPPTHVGNSDEKRDHEAEPIGEKAEDAATHQPRREELLAHESVVTD